MLFKAYNLIIDSDLDLGLPLVLSGTPDFYFKSIEQLASDGHKTNVFRKGIQAKIDIKEHKITLDWPLIGKFQAKNGVHLHYQKLTNDENVFKLFAISEALGLILQQKGYFLLHGSAVKVGEKAFVFIGEPGAGKSTTIAAFAKAGHSVLSDDMTAIAFDEIGKPVVIPSYPHIKIWEDSVVSLGFDRTTLEPAYEGHRKYMVRQSEHSFPSAEIPLEQIIVLQKPYSKKLNEVKLTDSPIELLKYYPLPQQILRGKHLEQHFTDSLKIAAQVQIKRVNRPKNYEGLTHFLKTFR